jgi:predicted amidohydrolase
MRIKVAAVQFQPILGKKDDNILKMNKLIDRAEDARLVILPELAASGYNFTSYGQAYSLSETLRTGKFVEFLREKARQKDIFIVSGFIQKSKTGLYNSSVLVGPGGILSVYRKTHLFMNEKDIFRKGEGQFPVVDIGGVRVGMAICFDYLFPELWRMQAMDGADIICHPSNLLTQNAHRCVPGLALMNRIYIITTNRTGREGELLFNGQSFITDPSGELLARASDNGEELIFSTVDTERSRNKWITPRNHAFKDRRPDLYKL